MEDLAVNALDDQADARAGRGSGIRHGHGDNRQRDDERGVVFQAVADLFAVFKAIAACGEIAHSLSDRDVALRRRHIVVKNALVAGLQIKFRHAAVALRLDDDGVLPIGEIAAIVAAEAQHRIAGVHEMHRGRDLLAGLGAAAGRGVDPEGIAVKGLRGHERLAQLDDKPGVSVDVFTHVVAILHAIAPHAEETRRLSGRHVVFRGRHVVDQSGLLAGLEIRLAEGAIGLGIDLFGIALAGTIVTIVAADIQLRIAGVSDMHRRGNLLADLGVAAGRGFDPNHEIVEGFAGQSRGIGAAVAAQPLLQADPADAVLGRARGGLGRLDGAVGLAAGDAVCLAAVIAGRVQQLLQLLDAVALIARQHGAVHVELRGLRRAADLAVARFQAHAPQAGVPGDDLLAPGVRGGGNGLDNGLAAAGALGLPLAGLGAGGLLQHGGSGVTVAQRADSLRLSGAAALADVLTAAAAGAGGRLDRLPGAPVVPQRQRVPGLCGSAAAAVVQFFSGLSAGRLGNRPELTEIMALGRVGDLPLGPHAVSTADRAEFIVVARLGAGRLATRLIAGIVVSVRWCFNGCQCRRHHAKQHDDRHQDRQNLSSLHGPLLLFFRFRVLSERPSTRPFVLIPPSRRSWSSCSCRQTQIRRPQRAPGAAFRFPDNPARSGRLPRAT